MLPKYNTSHFVLGEEAPKTEPEKSLSDIVFLVKDRLADALSDRDVGLAGTHPKVIISMVVTNILVNLMFNAIGTNDVQRRLDMVKDMLEEITTMTIDLWSAMEANQADTTMVN